MPEVQSIPRHNKDNPRGFRSPRDRGLDHWFNLEIPTVDDVRIHAWYIVHQAALMDRSEKKVPTIIFFHGNAGNIGLRIPNVWQMMQQLQCHVLMVEYRGYGDSGDEKKPNELGLQRDAEAVWQWITAETNNNPSHATLAQTRTTKVVPSSDALANAGGPSSFLDPKQLYLFGRSLGGAVAFHLARTLERDSRRLEVNGMKPPNLAGLIVENTFLSISHMVDRIFPFLKPIKAYVLRMNWNNQEAASQLVTTPVLYLAGAKDELVPYNHMETLYKTSLSAQNTKATLCVIEKGTHNDTWMKGGEVYWNAIRLFLTQTNDSLNQISQKPKLASPAINMAEQKECNRMNPMSPKMNDMNKDL